MSRIQSLLKDIFADLNELTEELRPFDDIIRASHGRPLAECGATDKIRIAIAILKLQKLEVPDGRKKP